MKLIIVICSIVFALMLFVGVPKQNWFREFINSAAYWKERLAKSTELLEDYLVQRDKCRRDWIGSVSRHH